MRRYLRAHHLFHWLYRQWSCNTFHAYFSNHLNCPAHARRGFVRSVEHTQSFAELRDHVEIAATFCTSTGGSFESISSESSPIFFSIAYVDAAARLIELRLVLPSSLCGTMKLDSCGRPRVGIVYVLQSSAHAATKFSAPYSSS